MTRTSGFSVLGRFSDFNFKVNFSEFSHEVLPGTDFIA